MVKTNYSGLNPVVVQALNNLQYRYSDETPEMWCSRISYPFKKLLENNPKYFSKNAFIQMTERSYKDGRFRVGERSVYIYCTVCDSLVTIRENTIEYANNHLNECITKSTKKHLAYSNPIQKKKGGRIALELSKDEIYEICGKFTDFPINLVDITSIITTNINHSIFRGLLRPETWAKRVWNMVRNDGTPDKKKFLGITPCKIRVPDDRYIDYIWDPSYLLTGINYGDRIQAKDMPAYYQNLPILYDHYSSQSWVEKKREQLWERLNNVAYIVAFIELHRQGYRIVEYSGWSYMLKWLSNPEYYRIDKYLNNGKENFVRSSEYVRYKCKLAGKHYQYNLLDIDYYKTGNISINGETTTINFSDLHNNSKPLWRFAISFNRILVLCISRLCRGQT
ncbi:hypothetical protein RhiirA4_480461 [Rhizophagus irregularis]|uniref:Uncharacterized protein n=1 Tax=Rhizophagus irregularis TaxID=588596 RepID=A0A2I1HHY0_9GLOM|nr:hypothetical protein RhiirA4_480461 [Rhizophagus irregularis]